MLLEPERPVRQERTGWRDEGLSKRHRAWGFDAPAVDIDFLMIEYDKDTPKALIEYKAYRKKINIQTSAIRAILKLANDARLPFFVVAYDPTEFWAFVKPMNGSSMTYLKEGRYLSEVEFVRLLYRVRGKVCPLHVVRRCNTACPKRKAS